MNLISCNNCGVVLDKNKLRFTEEGDYNPATGTTDISQLTWSSAEKRYVGFVECPVCNEQILDEEE